MSKKRSSLHKGLVMEGAALNHLKRQGLKLVARNFTSRFGEIDLIMKAKNILVFVEVRSRKNIFYGRPTETVSHTKQHKIILTAQTYLQKHCRGKLPPCRFDVVGVTLRDGQYDLEWVQAAFEEH